MQKKQATNCLTTRSCRLASGRDPFYVTEAGSFDHDVSWSNHAILHMKHELAPLLEGKLLLCLETAMLQTRSSR